MKTAKKFLKEKGIKDTLYDNGSWCKGGLSKLLTEYSSQPPKVMNKHKWKTGGKGWWNCTKCGLIREKHFGMPYVYYMDGLTECKSYHDKAPDCPPPKDLTNNK